MCLKGGPVSASGASKTVINNNLNKTANLKLKLNSLHDLFNVASRGGGDWLEVVSEDSGQVDCGGRSLVKRRG